LTQNINRLILIIVLVNFCTLTYSQDSVRHKRNWVKVGADFGLSYINPKDVNSLFDYWYNSINVIVEDEFFKGIHLGLSGTGYISIIPVRFFELRPQYEYSYNPYLVMIEEGSDLSVKIKTQKPGISGNFIFGPVRIGGGIYKYYSRIEWSDDLYQFSDTWKGNTIGYDAFFGLNKKTSDHFGWSFTFIYQYSVIEELTNKDNQVVVFAEEKDNLTLDLSGFSFKLGFYVAF
jgi:hypothetical protein